MDKKPKEPRGDDLLDELRRANDLLSLHVRNQRDWRLALRQGMIAGLGGAVGATLLVSLLLWFLQPLKHLSLLKPSLDRIAEQLERSQRR